MALVLRPWSDRLIEDCGEPLRPLHPALLCLRPHPYQSLGAPYGEGADPFVLRVGVRQRLIAAEQQLRQHHPDLRFAIVDAWRPIPVQRFMVEHAVAEEAARRGLPPSGQSSNPVIQAALDDVRCSVGRFWAPPSHDPSTPPPHSTGAAVDLTLADQNGNPLDLGGAIDAIDAVSEPEFYAAAARLGSDPYAIQCHHRRTLLARVLESQGFCRHPNEWWHFSCGDQLWAWRTGQDHAIYGRCDIAI
ncbi:MAG: M15 family metallopeptidase [Synechococcus sp.]